MSAEEKQSPFVEIIEHEVFYCFGQQSFSVGTSYAEEWDKNSWIKDDNGQPKQLKRGVFLTLPAARALVGVLKAAVEEAEAFELKRVLLKRQPQPKKPVDLDGHIAAYLKQCGIRTPVGVVGGCAGGPSDALGSSAERARTSERGTWNEPQFVGYSITVTTISSPAIGGTADGSGSKQTKPRGPRKQQKPETAGAANARAERPRKVLKADDDSDERDAGDGGDDGNDSDTRNVIKRRPTKLKHSLTLAPL